VFSWRSALCSPGAVLCGILAQCFVFSWRSALCSPGAVLCGILAQCFVFSWCSALCSPGAVLCVLLAQCFVVSWRSALCYPGAVLKARIRMDPNTMCLIERGTPAVQIRLLRPLIPLVLFSRGLHNECKADSFYLSQLTSTPHRPQEPTSSTFGYTSIAN